MLKSNTVQLSDVVTISTGKLDSNHASDDGEYPFFTCAPSPLKIDNYAYDCDAILLAGNNANGVFHLNRFNGRFNAYQRTYIITNKDESILNLDYMYYQLRTLTRMLGSHSQGTATKFLTMKLLSPLSVKLPPLTEQKAIAHILSTLDDKIELNRQMNETLEAMAQALFKSWFVDFDPVIDNALLAGKAIPEPLKERAELRQAQLDSGKAKANSKINDLFPSEFEFTEELGWIPEGWVIEELKNRIDVLNGFAFKSKDYTDEGVFVLRTKNFNLKNQVDKLSDDVYLPEEFLEEYSKYLCQPFDYHLIMVGASVGNRGLIEPHQLPALRNQNMWCFRTKKEENMPQSFVKYLLDYLTPSKLGLASGSARAFFRKGDFQTHLICLAPQKTLKEFDRTAFSGLLKKSNNNFQSTQLANLRDTLLPKLMSGELRIPDAEKLVENI